MATFEEQDGKPRLTTTSLFQTRQDRDGMLESGMEEGAAETLDRLAELLARQTQGRGAGSRHLWRQRR
jgi:uncharacterized protein YndB with AHSA1/START domain